MTNTPTLTKQLEHQPFPELADAICARIQNILKAWRAITIETLPHLDEPTIKEFENSIGVILRCAADTLKADGQRQVATLLHEAPEHGLDRFLQKYPLSDLLTENRMLRGVILLEAEAELGRPVTALEGASLHAAIDVMFHSATLSMVEAQQAKLRETAESELKFLSFFSHDLNNNMFVISARLDLIKAQLKKIPELVQSGEMLEAALGTIRHTRDGMNRLLKHEQLRRSKPKAQLRAVQIQDLVEMIVKPLITIAKDNGVQLETNIVAPNKVETDADLLMLVLQNIISNAVKHCGGGPVRITGGCGFSGQERCRISVADEGKGIAEDKLSRIFEAFERGEALGSPGVGLGLAIASQAAKLLGADIEVETKLGAGTTFHIVLPLHKQKEEALKT
jgi:signal transduction histidine kinase